MPANFQRFIAGIIWGLLLGAVMFAAWSALIVFYDSITRNNPEGHDPVESILAVSLVMLPLITASAGLILSLFGLLPTCGRITHLLKLRTH